MGLNGSGPYMLHSLPLYDVGRLDAPALFVPSLSPFNNARSLGTFSLFFLSWRTLMDTISPSSPKDLPSRRTGQHHLRQSGLHRARLFSRLERRGRQRVGGHGPQEGALRDSAAQGLHSP
ncbi:hypothetical protein Naga_102412g1 [Nannochloropsis gaditana]|uniref:Uncharacterized protein n=1 Tax=Nannochloropsis gaditana TaxID=72520 RepID=W7SZV0_9STRA|nr:hypothetical protein Naga_102412g1 [Nannochloropsis gaditana]